MSDTKLSKLERHKDYLSPVTLHEACIMCHFLIYHLFFHIFSPHPSWHLQSCPTHCRSCLALIVYHPCHLWLMNISHSYDSAAVFPCLHTIVLLALSTAAKSYSPLLSCRSLTPWSCSRSDSSQGLPHLLLKSSDSFHVIFYYLSVLPPLKEKHWTLNTAVASEIIHSYCMRNQTDKSKLHSDMAMLKRHLLISQLRGKLWRDMLWLPLHLCSSLLSK